MEFQKNGALIKRMLEKSSKIHSRIQPMIRGRERISILCPFSGDLGGFREFYEYLYIYEKAKPKYRLKIKKPGSLMNRIIFVYLKRSIFLCFFYVISFCRAIRGSAFFHSRGFIVNTAHNADANSANSPITENIL